MSKSESRPATVTYTDTAPQSAVFGDAEPASAPPSSVRRIREALSASVLVVGIVAGASQASARTDDALELSELRVRAPNVRGDVSRAFQRAVKREIGSLRLDAPHTDERYVLSMSLVSVNVIGDRRDETVRCKVSAVLRGQRTGEMVAMLTGRGTVQGRDQKAGPVAVNAAVKGAFSGIRRALASRGVLNDG